MYSWLRERKVFLQMPNSCYADFFAKYVDSTAYHEAGHITAAVVQGMPLRERGIHVDPTGRGIAYYWERESGDLENTEQDQEERKLTIVALYAAHAAQLNFMPDCP